jgi:hypothetical protein
MRIADMVEHLKNCGFEVKKEYITLESNYKFTIKKGSVEHSDYYSFKPGLSHTAVCIYQKNFLNKLIKDFENKFTKFKEMEKEMYISKIHDAILKGEKSGTLEFGGVTVPVTLDDFTLQQDCYGESELEFKGLVTESEADIFNYIQNDIKSTEHLMDKIFGLNPFAIKKVIFNEPATIVMWADGTKTVVKTQNGETYDPEKGLAMAITKKALGNKGNYFEVIKKWTSEYEKPFDISRVHTLSRYVNKKDSESETESEK